MKLYRIQCRYKNIYIDKTISAEDDKSALESFAKSVESGETEGTDEAFYAPDRVFITFEEVDRDVSTRTSGEKTSAGIQMGNASVVSGQSNS